MPLQRISMTTIIENGMEYKRLYLLKGKSGNMLSFKKSSKPDFYNENTKLTIHKIDLLLKEQVAQRKDLSVINALLKSLIADLGVQKQVDDYFEQDEKETSPQTDSGEQNGSNRSSN